MNTVVALPIVAASPTTAPAMPGEDPVFAAIQRHRDAFRATKESSIERDRLRAVVEQEFGPQGISVLDMRKSKDDFHPYVHVDCWMDIEKYVSPATEKELYKCYIEALANSDKARRDRFIELAGTDIDDYGDEHFDEEMEAGIELSQTTPTTLAGLLDLVIYVEEAQQVNSTFFAEQQYKDMFEELAKAARRFRRGHVV
jgi:hypothetical protein